MTKFPSGLIPPNADCATCPFLDIDYCEVLEEIVDYKQCGINVIEVEPDPEITYDTQTDTDTEGSTSIEPDNVWIDNF